MIFNRLKSSCCILATVILCWPSFVLADAFYDYKDLDRIIENLSKSPAAQKWKKDHPDFPVHSVLEALHEDRKGDTRKVIALLEPVLPQILYEAIYVKTKDGPKPYINTIGGFDLWRELAYLLLGRAYYDQNNDEQAQYYLAGLPQKSPFAPMAKVALAWSLLRAEKFDRASSEIGKARDLAKGNRALEVEADLQQAFFEAKKRNHEKAISIANSVSERTGSQHLDAIKDKILAQAEFSIYKQKYNSYNFNEKKVHLNRVMKHVESVPVQFRDAKFSFLAGETYWHAASAFRVEDPNKYAKAAQSSLEKSDDWLKPWVDRSIQQGRPLIDEDAFFLSVAVLWEREAFAAAIPRLKAISQFYPQGEYREDSYQLLADYYFDNRQFDQAITYYRKLADSGNIAKSAYGVYKAAWSFYNLKDKWATLRHLERLVLFFRKKKEEGDENITGSISTEAERDMLIVLAELLGHREAIKELTLFKYSRDYTEDLMNKLAEAYSNLGRFNEAIQTWQILIQENKNSEKNFEWLDQMLQNIVSAGMRKSLAKSLDLYLPMLPKQDSGNKEKHENLQKQIVKLVLTIHREARKTDDARIWEATDDLYEVVQKHYSEIQVGDFWYYGAQRMERRGRMLSAIPFYQKAAVIADYASAEDAALSALKIVRDLADKQSLKKAIDKKLYDVMGDVAQWYLSRFKSGKGLTPARFLLVEAKYKAEQFKEVREFFAELIKEEDKEARALFLTYNGWLYKDQNYLEAHLLSSEVLERSGGGKDKEFGNSLQKFRQETAFQLGFQWSRSKSKDAEQKSRQWYQVAIKSALLDDVTLKSWHNLLISFDVSKEADEFIRYFKEFSSSFDERKASRDQRSLLLGIYARVSELWKSRGNTFEQAKALSQAANYQATREKAADLKWESAVLFGTYYSLDEMKRALGQVESLNKKVLDNEENLLSVARLYFWNRDFVSAWKSLRPLLASRNPSPIVWVLVADLYQESRSESPEVYKVLRDYLVSNVKNLKKNSVLNQLFASASKKKFDPESALAFVNSRGRLPAGLDPDALKSRSAVDQLKARLNGVTSTLQEMEKHVSALTQFYRSSDVSPQTAVQALCMVPQVRREGARRMLALRSPAIQSKQWPDFVKQLNGKGKELLRTAQTEQNLCEKEQNSVAFLRPQEVKKSVFCSSESCFPNKASTDDIVGTLSALDSKKIDGLDKTYVLVKKGAWATAEFEAYQNTNLAERSLMLGYIRLARNDTWNGAPLLKQAMKDRRLASDATALLARAAWANGNPRYAQELIKSIRKSDLKRWQVELIDDIVGSVQDKTEKDPDFND